MLWNLADAMPMSFNRRHILFGVFAALLVAVNVEQLRALFELSRNNASASHLILIPFVTLALIYQSRRTIFSPVRTDAGSGSGLLVIGLGLGLSLGARWYGPAGNHDDSLTLLVGALVVLLVGGFLLLYGTRAFRAALFPLMFLVFMIPIPESVLNAATQLLKAGSAEAVAGLFTMTGTPYHREEFVFSLPGVAIEIADACSGIRSSIALLLTSLLAGHVFLSRPGSKILLTLAILPIAILKNGIRIVSLSLLSIHVDPEFLTGQLHHEGGVVFYLLALAILGPVLVVLHKSEARRSSNPGDGPTPRPSFGTLEAR